MAPRFGPGFVASTGTFKLSQRALLEVKDVACRCALALLKPAPTQFWIWLDQLPFPGSSKIEHGQRCGVTIDHGAGAIKVITKDWIGTCPIV